MNLKNSPKSLRMLALASALVVSFTTCKKSGESDCGGSGVIMPNSYRFWTAATTNVTEVIVKDRDGNIPSFDRTIRRYYNKPTEGWEPDPCTYNASEEAVYNLTQGKRYTWTATDGFKSWSGSINVPCEQNQCFNVELK